jgi:hypothetical protein
MLSKLFQSSSRVLSNKVNSRLLSSSQVFMNVPRRNVSLLINDQNLEEEQKLI